MLFLREYGTRKDPWHLKTGIEMTTLWSIHTDRNRDRALDRNRDQ